MRLSTVCWVKTRGGRGDRGGDQSAVISMYRGGGLDLGKRSWGRGEPAPVGVCAQMLGGSESRPCCRRLKCLFRRGAQACLSLTLSLLPALGYYSLPHSPNHDRPRLKTAQSHVHMQASGAGLLPRTNTSSQLSFGPSWSAPGKDAPPACPSIRCGIGMVIIASCHYAFARRLYATTLAIAERRR